MTDLKGSLNSYKQGKYTSPLKSPQVTETREEFQGRKKLEYQPKASPERKLAIQSEF
eukprot:CAMPEP_0202956980 /NCGR_PEP_ID=MMETSP1396-20130829/1421_1 /ASSEMBLY_ACC=CAM_ASM_000872 /TAXON_ID= /ORGANISM="Pseudokeronopsis sp., Strain Brazil" /LENGTH=56 /DNA_ID=CAMNT_0049674227 /DNA_START=624 /DNA_END=794 /DNA_ORIENTATION=+